MMGPASDGIRLSGDAAWARHAQAQNVSPPALTLAQRQAAEFIGQSELGAWARALADGRAEVFTPRGAGLRRFVLDAGGFELEVHDIAARGLYVWGRRLSWALLAVFVAGCVAWATLHSERLWLWPVGSLVALATTALIALGVRARLPRRRPDAGRWAFFPPSSDAKGGFTAPRLVRASPFGAAWLWFLVSGFTTLVVVDNASWGRAEIPLALVIGTSLWWLSLVGVSRGWIEFDD